MTKISSKSAYPLKTPDKNDYFVGTDSVDVGKTVNFKFEDATKVINDLNGQSVVGYKFKTSGNIPLDVLTEAEFYSLGNETTIANITKLYINKFTKNSVNLTKLYNYLLINSTEFLFKLQGTDPNVYVYFNLTSIENHLDYYIFNVTVYKANLELTTLTDFGEYFFNFELRTVAASDITKLDKSTYSGNAQDLDNRLDVLESQTDVSNTFIVKPTFSLAANTLTIGALGQWKLLGVAYSNPASVDFPITFCATGKTRLDYFVPNNTNGFTKISGVETLGMAIAPQLPNEGLYVTYVLVTDSSVGEPITPPTVVIPTLQQVLESGFATNKFIWFWNTINSKCTRFASDHILFQKLESVFNFIKSDNTTQSYTVQLPNKLGGAEETFAMVSDIPLPVDISGKENTANKQNSLTTDGTGVKYVTVDAVNDALPKNYAKIVYVNSTNPSTATIFDIVNPPVTNDNLLKTDVANLYIGTDVSTWVYDGTIFNYVTKTIPAISNFFISGSSTDAGNDKIQPIKRNGTIESTGFIKTGGISSQALLANGSVLSNPISGTGTSGQVSFWNGTSTQTGDNGLFWDNTNKRLGIGTATPSASLDILGNIKVSNQISASGAISGSGYYAPSSASILNLYGGRPDFSTSGISFNSAVTPFTSFMYINTIGRVGFGTITPAAKLVVNSGELLVNTNTNNGIDKLQVNGSTKTTALTLSTSPTTSASTYDILTRNSSTGVVEKVASSSALLWTDTAGTIRNNNSGAIELKPTGNISILNSSNVETATISSTGSFTSKTTSTGFFGTDGASGMYFDNSSLNFRNYGSSVFRFNPIYLNWTDARTQDVVGFSNSTINPSSGTATFNMLNISPTVNQTGGANGITRALYINPTLTAAADFRAIEVTGGNSIFQKVIAQNTIRLKNYTVATLPTGTQGDTAYVTDALAPTYLVTVVGGGAVVCPVFYDGVSWKSH